MRKHRNTSLRYKALRFLCGVLGLVLALMLSVTLLFRAVTERVSFADPVALPQLSQEELDAFLNADSQTQNLSYSDSTAETAAGSDTLIGGQGSGLINILLVGQDRREGESRARSDTMILCTFNTDSRTLTMTSFLRDLYVQIPGYRDNRINAAYAAGGLPLLRQTFQENFGIHIDGCMEADFDQFPQLIDLLGGVSMELRQDEAEYINNALGGLLGEGEQILNGDQALLYARIRKLDADGDFSRTNRQRKILSALLESCRNASVPGILELLSRAIPMVSTDMNEAKVAALAVRVLPMLSDMEVVSQRIPADGTYTSQTINEMAVLVADMEANRSILKNSLYGN